MVESPHATAAEKKNISCGIHRRAPCPPNFVFSHETHAKTQKISLPNFPNRVRWEPTHFSASGWPCLRSDFMFWCLYEIAARHICRGVGGLGFIYEKVGVYVPLKIKLWVKQKVLPPQLVVEFWRHTVGNQCRSWPLSSPDYRCSTGICSNVRKGRYPPFYHFRPIFTDERKKKYRHCNSWGHQNGCTGPSSIIIVMLLEIYGRAS